MSLSRMKHILAIERDSFLSDIDDLTISLNLHQLNPSLVKSCLCQAETIDARQGMYVPEVMY
jgi:hypothetical protein